MLFTHNLIYLVRFSLRFIVLFDPFPYKIIPKSNILTFVNTDMKILLISQKLQIVFSAVIAFQLLRFRSEFQNGMIYEGVYVCIFATLIRYINSFLFQKESIRRGNF